MQPDQPDPTIKGHPAIVLPAAGVNGEQWDQQITITVCAECERMRTILFLDRDRWLCTACRNSGSAAPAVVPITRPRRRRGTNG